MDKYDIGLTHHIIDRESDSVAFMRDLEKIEALFLLRVKKSNKAAHLRVPEASSKHCHC